MDKNSLNNIIEQGTHEELLSKKGAYYKWFIETNDF